MPSKLFGSKSPKIPGLVTPGKAGTPGEIADLRSDVDEAFSALEAQGGVIVTEDFTNLAAASANYFKASVATATTEQTFTRAAGTLNAAAELVPPRNITVTTTSNANVNAVSPTFTGRVRDRTGTLITQTDTFALTDDGGATDAGTKAFSFLDEATMPAHGGTGGAYTIGYGNIVGLTKKLRTIGSAHLVLQQQTNGSVVTNGTFVAAATRAPNGTWSPNSAPNGTNDYTLVYVTDNA